jgi:hypothetical protein
MESSPELPACDEGVERKIVKNQITKDNATKAVRRWWRSWLMAWGLRWHGQITRCKFMYVPFWIVKARVSGMVEGERDLDDESYSATAHCKYTIDGNLIWNGIACDSRDVGIEYLWYWGGESVLYNTYAAYAKETTVSKEEGLAEGIAAIKERAIQLTGKLDRIFITNIDVVPLEIKKIIYPLWVVEYCYGENTYSVTIDGVHGDILAGRAPGNDLIKRFSTIFGLLLLVMGVTLFIIGCCRINNDGVFCGEWIVAAICPFIAYEAFQYGQRGATIVRGQVEDGYKPLRYYKKHKRVEEDGYVEIKRKHKIRYN